MELNFTCISGEISNIINNRKKYNPYISLICLALKEMITKINDTHILSTEFVTYLTFVKEYIQCDIDFDLLTYLCNNDKYVNISDSAESLYSNLSYSISSSSDDLDNKITKMLINDFETVNKISQSRARNNNINVTAKNVFDIIDYDNDGMISALDLLITIDNNKKITLKEDFINSMINILITYSHDKIHFNIFLDNFF